MSTCEPLNYGTPGNGTTPQLLHRTPIYADHIPYQGGSQSLTDLICGQIDFMSENLPVVYGALAGDQVRALGVTSGQSILSMPDLPTLK